VREVVVRVLRGLRAGGLVRTGRDEIELLDVHRLLTVDAGLVWLQTCFYCCEVGCN
jgi:hypothetical protein